MFSARIEIDEDSKSPCEWFEWKFISFNRNHSSFCDHSEYITGVDEEGDLIPANIGFNRKLDCGTAFVLSCYDHSGIYWSLKGEGQSCPWDSTQNAGLLIWEGKAKDCGKDYKDREGSARYFLEEYTSWCNDEVYRFAIQDGNKNYLEGCGGFYSVEDAITAIKEDGPYKEDTVIIQPDGTTELIPCANKTKETI